MSNRQRQSPGATAHDILAAEAFAVPAPDPDLRHDLVLPGDPAGIAEPHDILAAEEFAMPAPEPRAAPATPGAVRRRRTTRVGLVGAGVLALWLRRRRW